VLLTARMAPEVARVISDRDSEIALGVFREANDALVIFEPQDGRIVEVNPTALRLTGLARKAALALRLGDLLSSPDPDDFRRLMAAGQATGYFRARDGFQLVTAGGGSLPVDVGLSRIHTRPAPLGLAIIRDVSVRVRAEAALIEARDSLEARVLERTAELAEANRAMRAEIAERLRVEAELRLARDAAEDAGRAKDRLLSALSHELRTPLTPVLAVVSALLEGPEVDPALRRSLEMVRRNVTLEARLIDDLLDYTRAAPGDLRLRPEPVDALELIDQAVAICREELDASGVRAVVEPGEVGHRVEADPARLLQVLCNLIRNAARSTGPGGTLAIRTGDPGGGRLAVAVVDDGRGFGPEGLARIFEPFEQGRATPDRPAGLNLGLAACRSIVEAHGGRIDAASEGPGRGATLTFDVPRADGPGTGPATPASPRAGLEILLVEDNKDILRYLKLVLEMRGHRVRAAANLESARAELARPFDLLVSDIELPDGSGLDLMRELRGRVPGFAISGFGSPDDVRMSLEAGFTLHLTKPIEVGRLDEAIAWTLDEAARRVGPSKAG